MQYRVREAALLLDVTEDTIYRWVEERGLPAIKVGEQIRFNHAELLEWATAQGIEVSSGMFASNGEPGDELPSLADALRTGGIHFHLPGENKEAVIRCAIDLLPLPDEVDRELCLAVCLARESMGSTAIGNGIAIPHVRHPMVMDIPHPIAALCFLARPVEFGAADGLPVDILFTLVSPTISAHLNLLSKLSYAIHQSVFLNAILRHATALEILAVAERIDHIAHRASTSSEEKA